MTHEEFKKLNLSNDIISNVLRNNDGEFRDMVLKYILFKSGSDDSTVYSGSIINDLLDVAKKFNNDIGQLALDSIINITATEKGNKLITCEHATILLSLALRRDGVLADHACKALANITRNEEKSIEVAQKIMESFGVGDIMTAVCDKSFNEKGLRLEYLAQVVGNLMQSSEFRGCLLDPVSGQFQRLLPILEQGATVVERRGIASALYNCLIDLAHHLTLLQEPYDLLPVLLYPLAGPEEFQDSEYEQLPIDLQYLPDDKEREADTQVRHLLLKCLLLLCRIREPRVFVREHGAYLILREYHKWERDGQLLLATENVVDLLIKTEEEIGIDDVGSIEVPGDMIEKFKKLDEQFIAQSS